MAGIFGAIGSALSSGATALGLGAATTDSALLNGLINFGKINSAIGGLAGTEQQMQQPQQKQQYGIAYHDTESVPKSPEAASIKVANTIKSPQTYDDFVKMMKFKQMDGMDFLNYKG